MLSQEFCKLPECGTPFIKKVPNHKFCCYKHNRKFYFREIYNKKVTYIGICKLPECENIFIRKHNGQRFCCSTHTSWFHNLHSFCKRCGKRCWNIYCNKCRWEKYREQKYVNDKCPRCGEKKLFPRGTFKINDEPFKRQKYNCRGCGRWTSLTKKIYKGRCKFCNGRNITYHGSYRTKSKPKKRRRYYCYDCKKSLSSRRINSKSALDIDIVREIKKLANERKMIPNKYSNLRKKNLKMALLYTDSDIVKIIKKKFRRKISRTAANNWIKKFRKTT